MRFRRLPPLLLLAALAAEAVVSTAMLATPVRGDDLDTVSTRIKSDLQASAPSTTTVNGHLSSLGSDGRWSDVDYADNSQTGWSQRTHLQRLLSMSAAYSKPTHSLYGSASLLAGIVKAYDSFVALDPRSTNWWFNDIDTPQLLGGTILLVQPQLTAAQITSGTAIVARSYIPRSTNAGTNTGTNRVDRAYATILRGVITRSSPLTSEAFAAIGDTLVTTTAEGIQPDYSFHQHGPQLHNGSYGLIFGSLSLDITSYSVGTQYALDDVEAHVIVNYLLDGQQWMLRGTTFEATAQGRGITRSSSKNLGSGIIGVIDQAKTMSTYRAAEMTAMRGRLNAAKTSGTASPKLALVGHKHFWRSDYTAHHRAGFSATVKVSSTRTLEPESGNGEGLQNLHLADGVNLIQQRGNEYTDIQPIWDWRRLPGTTTEQAAYSLRPPSDWGVAGSMGFAGGVTDGRNGVTVLDYSQRNVKARKSWFFFDDVEVAMGAGIDAPAATGEVITTVNQAFQKGSTVWSTTSGSLGSLTTGTVSRGDVSWVLHDGIGYVFAAPQAVSVRTAVQSGSWSGINTSQSSTLVTGTVFSLQVSHGTIPSGGSYAYTVLPGANGTTVASYANAPTVRILANTRTLQAARHDGMALTQAAFYASGTLATGSGATLTVREPSLVMFDESAAAPQVTVSNPYGQATTIHADVVRKRAEGPDDLTRLTIRLSGSDEGGASVSRVLDQPATRTFAFQLRDGAAAVAPLVYQWSFEGATATDRLRNSGTGGGATLQAVAYGSEGSTARIAYGMGLDETTAAMSPQRIGRYSSSAGGALLATTGTVAIPTAFTVEALVRPDVVEVGGSIGYAVMAGGQATNNRGYFIVGQEGAAADTMSTIIGDSISQADNVGTTTPSFTPGHWYYVANTYTVSGSQTTISSYVADLTLGQTAVTQAVAGQVASGKPLTAAQMAIGGSFVSGTAQEAWSGSIDEVSLFGRVLTAAEVQARLSSIYRQPDQVSWSAAASGTAVGGSGTWATTGMRWVNGTGRMSPITTARALFRGSGGTVAVSGRVTASGLGFQSSGFLLTGGTIALGSGSAQPVIDVAAGVSGTIAARLSGTSGLVKTGAGTLTLVSPPSVTGTVQVAAGRLAFSGSAALPGAILAVAASGSATLPDDPGFELRVAGLSIADTGGRVDLGPARLVVAAGGISRADLLADLAAGRGAGGWDGAAGLVSRTVAAAVGAGQSRSLGWLAEPDGSFTVAYAAAGDTNLDGMIDIIDAANTLSASLLDSGRAAAWAEGDFNYDGFVDVLDVAESLGTGLFDTGSYLPAAAIPVAAVPEPAAWWVGIGCVAACAAWRRGWRRGWRTRVRQE
ncbi:MAG: polysaccharide lyase family 8 super-sandwich domain-containing protein [Planctomycetaceae bacterium]